MIVNVCVARFFVVWCSLLVSGFLKQAVEKILYQ